MLTQDDFYIRFARMDSKERDYNEYKSDRGCFKWAVIATLHQEDIVKDLHNILKLQHY